MGGSDVTFNPGETEKRITVFIYDDEIAEPLERFKATLSAGAKATVVAPSEAHIFIQDNDGMIFSLKIFTAIFFVCYFVEKCFEQQL